MPPNLAALLSVGTKETVDRLWVSPVRREGGNRKKTAVRMDDDGDGRTGWLVGTTAVTAVIVVVRRN